MNNNIMLLSTGKIKIKYNFKNSPAMTEEAQIYLRLLAHGEVLGQEAQIYLNKIYVFKVVGK